jgi:hypothetical protein
MVVPGTGDPVVFSHGRLRNEPLRTEIKDLALSDEWEEYHEVYKESAGCHFGC